MTQVETVRGPVDTSELGRTYMHEHIFVLTPDVQLNYPDEWGREEERVADAVAKLRAAAAQGTRTFVDPTVIGLGRYIPRIVTIAEQVPELHLVVATGCYTYDTVPFFFAFRGPVLSEAAGVDVPDPMVDMFVKDITEGIAGTGVKAAFLKCAIEHELTPDVARIMRAVARAHRHTGAPITVHTHPGHRNGLEVKRVLCDEEGVDPGRVVLGHSGDSDDADHLSELADHGFILGMDRFGLSVGGATFERRCDIVVEMCRRGYADRMVLSHDAACYIDWIDPHVRALMDQWHYLHIADDVLPYLLDHGVSQDQIDTMLVATPRRYFENSAAY